MHEFIEGLVWPFVMGHEIVMEIVLPAAADPVFWGIMVTTVIFWGSTLWFLIWLTGSSRRGRNPGL